MNSTESSETFSFTHSQSITVKAQTQGRLPWKVVQDLYRGEWVELTDYRWEWDELHPRWVCIRHHSNSRQALIHKVKSLSHESSSDKEPLIVLVVSDK